MSDFSESAESAIAGRAASPGRATGQARVLPADADTPALDAVGEGDVLVARRTDQRHVPAMGRAAAVVTDVGGVTSHAAVVAREFGLPAVVATESATQALTDGETFTVDGDCGTVVRGGGDP